MYCESVKRDEKNKKKKRSAEKKYNRFSSSCTKLFSSAMITNIDDFFYFLEVTRVFCVEYSFLMFFSYYNQLLRMVSFLKLYGNAQH